MNLNLSLASFPGLHYSLAVKKAFEEPHFDPLYGQLSLQNIQLVPQNFGVITPDDALSLKENFPQTNFRLHANTAVERGNRTIYDLSNAHNTWAMFEKAAYISKLLGSKGYSAHTGLRSAISLEETIEVSKKLTDLFECPVGIEGQYPTPKAQYVLSTWEEYASLLDTDAYFVIDLSHLNIVAHRTKQHNLALTKELVNCDRCIEVHVSDNNGTGDHHQRCHDSKWWNDALGSVHEQAVIFYEGNLLREIYKPHDTQLDEPSYA